MKRVVTGAILALAVFFGVRYAPLWLFWGAVSLLGILASRELCTILRHGQRAPWPLLSTLGVLATMAAFLVPQPPVGPVLVGALGVLVVRALFERSEAVVCVDRLMGSLLVVVYLGLTLGHVGGLLAATIPDARETGEDLLIFAILVVYAGDTSAYYGGRTFGRRKLAPRLSPKKTWEGAIFGLLGSLLASLLAPFWFYQELPLAHALALAGLLALLGIAGDLIESLIKRAAQIKDSGGLLPGHGGILDRIDSLLFAAPALYWYHRLFLP